MALKSQEHGKTVPMKHKLKSRIKLRKQKGRSKEDEEDDRRMLSVPLCLLLSPLFSLSTQGLLKGRGGCFVIGKSGWLPQCLYVETHRSLSLSVF